MAVLVVVGISLVRAVLLVVAIVVVLFGAAVLLWFPDRPGGKIAWRGMEVSSPGAGLPLIALGLIAIALVAAPGLGTGQNDSAATNDDDALGCFADVFGGIPVPEDRIKNVQDGASDVDVIVAGQSIEGAAGLRLYAGDGRPLGAVAFRFVPAPRARPASPGELPPAPTLGPGPIDFFTLERVVDSRCKSADITTAGTSEDAVANHDVVRVRFGDACYSLRLNAGEEIRVDFSSVAC